MTAYVKILLAAMMTLITPGQSVYSQVPLKVCDEACQNMPVCANQHDLKCRTPQLNQYLYNENLLKYASQEEARSHSFTRTETYEEGLVRYVVIANAISEVSEEATFSECKKKCTDNACIKSCNKTAPWRWSKDELAFMMLTMASQEAGFRSDVHGGVGASGRGDCLYATKDGKPAGPGTKGAKPIPGTCRSVCLGQTNIGKGKTSQGWTAEDLVGIDFQSTKRCLTVMALNLTLSRGYCNKWAKGKNWPKSTFAAYGSGNSCTLYQKKWAVVNGTRVAQYSYRVKDDSGKVKAVWGVVPPNNAIDKNPLEAAWPINRSQLFWLSMNKKRKLDSKTEQALQNPEIQKAIGYLMSTQTPVNWMTPISS